MKLGSEFIAVEQTRYPVRIGKHIASGLSGFIAGAVVATIVWLTAIYLILPITGK